jgi:medium-chain acyl-[acyl-carrier-protein] hydrolase
MEPAMRSAAEMTRARQWAAGTLLCLPPAGATAGIFSAFRPFLPAELALLPLELPGHGARFAESPVGSMRALIDRLLPEALALTPRPFAMFGYSLGAKIGFELARALAACGRSPVHLFVAASPSDRFPEHGRGLHLRSRDEVVAELRRLGGTPARVLDEERLLGRLMPAIRADLQLAAEYEVLPGLRLACPVTAFAGTRDPDITVEDVAGWARHTSGPFRLTRFDAGHHFLKERAAQIVDEILRALEEQAS